MLVFARGLAMAALVATSGCSFVWSRSPRSPCAQYYVVPVIDAVFTGTLLYGAIDASTTSDSNKNALIVAGVVGAVGFGLSTVYGIRQVRRCERGT